VIGILRFAGILVISVWLGAAVFFLTGVGPGAESEGMQQLLGARNYEYYATAIAQIFGARLFYFELTCGALALLHVLASWLYLGKNPRRFWLGLLACVVGLTLLEGAWLQPKLRRLHLSGHAVNLSDSTRQQALGSLKGWGHVDVAIQLCVVAGLALYLWRLANPSDPPRFVSAVKFRS
jgi:hypothetical protein